MTGVPRGAGLPAGGIGLEVSGYAEFVAKEYLADYVASGGAAVRFVVAGDEGVARRWHARLAEVAAGEGYEYVAADAADTKVHMIDQLYAAVARRLDWADLARRQVAAAWESIGLPPPAPDELGVAAVAAATASASRRRRAACAASWSRHCCATPRWRGSSGSRCCGCARPSWAPVTSLAAEREAVIAWLRVEPVALRMLKSASLYGRIARNNARSMLVSLVAWRAQVVRTGLVLDLDLTRLAMARRPPLEEREGQYYSKAAVLDAYEVLRQLVDATDVLRNAFIAVTLPPELVTDEARGLPAYSRVATARRRRGPRPSSRQPVRRAGAAGDTAGGDAVTSRDRRARRAVEALRSGVPSRDAVAALGSGQGDIEDTFLGLLDGAAGMRTHAAACCSAGGSVRARATCSNTWHTSRSSGGSW